MWQIDGREDNTPYPGRSYILSQRLTVR